jgi:hypothetical protein
MSFIDVFEGTITNLGIYDTPQPQESGQSVESWRLYTTKPIREFFATCQDKMSGASLVANRNYIRV